jgi:hypothetical protein
MVFYFWMCPLICPQVAQAAPGFSVTRRNNSGALDSGLPLVAILQRMALYPVDHRAVWPVFSLVAFGLPLHFVGTTGTKMKTARNPLSPLRNSSPGSVGTKRFWQGAQGATHSMAVHIRAWLDLSCRDSPIRSLSPAQQLALFRGRFGSNVQALRGTRGTWWPWPAP